ncbi:MAG: class I SAM-dependent methyltransferase [Kiloniellales bacterium]
MPPLAERLAQRIARHGPMTVADYMTAALTDPEQGYYATRDPLGRQGDFITAPEISQMFGELIGLWCADVWRAMAAPDPVLLAELGPGRGTLLADALRAARRLPAFAKALRLHLVEVSPQLRERQAAALAAFDLAAAPQWHDGLETLPEGPLLLIANEFFDALPIRQFEKSPQGWSERLVALDGNGNLCFGLAPPSPATALLIPPAMRDAPDGAVAEISPAALGLLRDIARRLVRHGGAALIIDYGAERPSGRPTLQAVRRHQPQAVLLRPGEADLTAHVDFGALAAEARAAGAAALGPVPQGAFLRAIGLEARAAALTRGASDAQARDIAAAVERLTAPALMGTLFQALAMTGTGLPSPAGFGDAQFA